MSFVILLLPIVYNGYSQKVTVTKADNYSIKVSWSDFDKKNCNSFQKQIRIKCPGNTETFVTYSNSGNKTFNVGGHLTGICTVEIHVIPFGGFIYQKCSTYFGNYSLKYPTAPTFNAQTEHFTNRVDIYWSNTSDFRDDKVQWEVQRLTKGTTNVIESKISGGTTPGVQMIIPTSYQGKEFDFRVRMIIPESAPSPKVLYTEFAPIQTCKSYKIGVVPTLDKTNNQVSLNLSKKPKHESNYGTGYLKTVKYYRSEKNNFTSLSQIGLVNGYTVSSNSTNYQTNDEKITTNLTPGKTYYYYAVGYDKDGKETTRSTPVSIKVPYIGKISGYVKTADNVPIEGVRVALTGIIANFTNSLGYYEFTELEFKKYEVRAEKTGHTIEVKNLTGIKTKEITLSNNNRTEEVDFVDKSSFTTTILTENASCPIGEVEVFIDDKSIGKTNNQGKISVALLAGEHKIAIAKQGIIFNSSTITKTITANGTIPFTSTTKYAFSGNISDNCGNIIGQGDIVLQRENCSNGTVTKATNNDGTFSVSVSALAGIYTVDVINFKSFSNNNTLDQNVNNYNFGLTVDLSTKNQNINLVYRNKPQVNLSNYGEAGCGNYTGVQIVEQGVKYNLNFDVIDKSGNQSCPVDTGMILIFNGGIPDTTRISQGKASYDFIPTRPTVTGDYTSVFNIQTIVGSDTITSTEKILIKGNKPQDGQNFKTSTPQLPLMILRDPPGDLSYSWIKETASNQLSMSFSNQSSSSTEAWIETKLGSKFEFGLGASTEVEVWGKVKGSMEVGSSVKTQTELDVVLTNVVENQTSGDRSVVGSQGDLYIGGAMAVVYKKTTIVKYDQCIATLDTAMIMGIDSLKSTYLYTEADIIKKMKDNLREINNPSSTLNKDDLANENDVWQQTLDLNKNLKLSAQEIKRLQFSGGAGKISGSWEMTKGKKSAIDFNMHMDAKLAAEVGFEVAGSGASGGTTVSTRMEIGNGKVNNSTTTTEIGYSMDDSNVGDSFLVTILRDNTFGTPVFRLHGGATSCPWEEGTSRRDDASISANTFIQTDIPVDDMARFELTISNLNAVENGETRKYVLTLDEGSNSEGARIVVGSGNSSSFNLTINAGKTQKIAVDISRGNSKAFSFKNIRFTVSSSCSENATILDEVFLNASFKQDCSNLRIDSPSSNWNVSSTNNNELTLDISDYTLANLTSLILQYKSSNSTSWTDAKSYFNYELGATTSSLKWNVQNLNDGNYDVRFKFPCGTGYKVTDPISGTIDRTVPFVIGAPSPSDSLLTKGDVIQVNFNEDIDCSSVSASNFNFKNLGDQTTYNVNFGCWDNTIIINPLNISFNTPQGFEVQVKGIKDLAGNTMTNSSTWDFLVKDNSNFTISDSSDFDNDTIISILDNCDLTFNPYQKDLDKDGIGDLCDDDMDNDLLINTNDNCPMVSNKDQEDLDKDGIGDLCDDDIDGDGIENALDVCPKVSALIPGDAKCSSVNTSTINKLNKENVIIFPNPAYDVLYLQEAVEYKIYSLIGELLLEGNSNEINISDLLSGAYIIEFNNAHKKFIKQ